MRRSLRGLFLVLALLLAPLITPLLSPLHAMTAQASGTIEVHARMCDEVPADGDWFNACHDMVAPGVHFDAINTASDDIVSGTTDAGGNVVLTVPAGTWQLSGPPGDFLEATLIYCSTGAGTPEVPHPVTIGDGTAVICDYYFVPANLSGLGTIEVHGRICDEVPASGNWFDACHDDLAVDVHFDAMNVDTGAIVSGQTGADGNLLFELEAGTWRLSGPPGDFLEATFIYCSTGAGTTEVAHPVVLESGDAVICDYYVVPERQGPEPTVVPTVAPTAVPPTPTPTPVPREPALELPVVLVAGSCADVMNATEVTTLSDAVVHDGDPDGSVDAIQAAVGYTRVSIPLSTLTGADHVIAVLDRDGEEVIACGAIGGVSDGQGAYTIGLAPTERSGAAGTAYLAPSGNGTGISVFVVPNGLVPEAVIQPRG